MRFFLVDRVTELVAGERARGVKCVTLGDEVLHDHFPDYPIMPGVLVIEALAQLAGFLIETSTNRPGEPVRRALLGQIERAKFSAPAQPGDRLDLRVTLEQTLDAAARVHAEAYVDQARVVRAGLLFMLKTIDSERVHEQRRYLYKLWTRTLDPPPVIL